MGRILNNVAEAGAAGIPSKSAYSFSISALTRLLWPWDASLRERMYNLLSEDVFRVRYGESVATERARTRARVARLHSAGAFRHFLESDRVAAARHHGQMVSTIALLDHSLEIALGVNFGLFLVTVVRLGSPAQSAYWVPRIAKGLDSGCFALTELGHGSNVRGIETEAVYDAPSAQFVLHSPTESSQKYWIGGAGEVATWAVVFARLILKGQFKGIHVFLVQLRDKKGNVQPGIQIADCGVKAGLNGVDNGRIWFNKLRIPREHLLNGMCQVSENGEYSSSFPSPDAMFAATLAALTGGRVGIAYNAVTSSMLALTIAVRYSLVRRAFAPEPGAEEVPLLYYTSQQRRLMIPLASALVYFPCAEVLNELWYSSKEVHAISREVHSLSAAFKALFSWYMQDTLQTCREACGGQGYKLENRIALIKADRDIMMTFEGANDVLMQQVGKGLLAEYGRAQKTRGVFRKGSQLEALNDNDLGLCDRESNPLSTNSIRCALQRRERKCIENLGAQHAAAKGNGLGDFAAWNECLHVAEAASTAHVHRRIFDMHLKTIEDAQKVPGNCDRPLELAGHLWAADILDKDPAFLRLGCVTKAYAENVRKRIPWLCKDMSAIAKDVTDAFEFPPHLLAPIARDYIAHNSRARL